MSCGREADAAVSCAQPTAPAAAPLDPGFGPKSSHESCFTKSYVNHSKNCFYALIHIANIGEQDHAPTDHFDGGSEAVELAKMVLGFGRGKTASHV